MTSEDQDQTDRIQQLEQRIEELENKQQLSKTSRRGLLGGIVGVAGLGAMSGSGAAASGQVGTANNRVNVFADEVDANTVTGLFSGGYNDETANRSRDTTFTNSGSPLFVSVLFEATSSATDINENFKVDGRTVDKIAITLENSNDEVAVNAIVPSGADYEVASFSDPDIDLKTWRELSF